MFQEPASRAARPSRAFRAPRAPAAKRPPRVPIQAAMLWLAGLYLTDERRRRRYTG